eukprot:jgi/Picsp_1/3001/NSC_01224-R1_rna exonuclease 4 homolog ( cerevisiae)
MKEDRREEHTSKEHKRARKRHAASSKIQSEVGSDSKKRKRSKSSKEKSLVITVDISERNSTGKSNWEALRAELPSTKSRTKPQPKTKKEATKDDANREAQGRGALSKVVALDCEMVECNGNNGVPTSMLARVSIVNILGEVVYDSYVAPTDRVTDYRTQFSGIRPSNLRDAPPKSVVVSKVKTYLEGRIVVGHALHNDFEVLDIEHPVKHVRDSSRYPPFMRRLISGKMKPQALRNVVLQELGMVIQNGEHDSIQDAQAVLNLYNKHKVEWEKWAARSLKHSKNVRNGSNLSVKHYN